MNQLTIETIDQIIDWGLADEAGRLNLRAVQFADPFGLMLLHLLILERSDRGHPLAVMWPQSTRVRRWMQTMGVSMNLAAPFSPTPQDIEGALQPITRIDAEAEIGRVVDGFHHRLLDRYPLTESSRRALVAVMIELFQNIPHHSNATGQAANPHGIAAMQDDGDGMFLSVADKGIGLAASLGLRDGYENLSDAAALDVIFHQGMSRFADPGRGGELRRIAELVRSWDGAFALRTGCALYTFDPQGGGVYDVPHFPGVQLALRLPRHVFQ